MINDLQLLNKVLKIQKDFIIKNDNLKTITEIFKLILEVTNSSLGFVGEYKLDNCDHLDFIIDTRKEFLLNNHISDEKTLGDFGRDEYQRKLLIKNKEDLNSGIINNNEFNYMLIPICIENNTIGLFGIADKNTAYSSDLVVFLESIIIGLAQNLYAKKNKEQHKIDTLKLRKKELYLSALNTIAGLLMREHEIFPWQAIVDELGKATGTSRVTINLLDILQNGELAAFACAEWCNTNISAEINNVPALYLNENTQRLFEIIQKGEVVDICVSKIPEEPLKELFMKQGTKSILVIPILIDNVFYGILGFDNCVDEKEWALDEKEYLITATEYISLALKRKYTENALNLSEEKFRTFADFTFDMEYWVNPDGQMLFVSNACKRITGYNQEEFLKNNDLTTSLIYPEDLNIYNNHLNEYHTFNGNPSECIVEFRIIAKDGKITWIQHGCNAVYSKKGQYIGRRASNRDITEMKQAVEQLSKSKENNKALVEAIPDLLFLVSKDGVVLDIKFNSNKIIKNPRENYLNKQIKELVTSDIAEQAYEKLRLALKNKTVQLLEVGYGKDNNIHYFECRFVVFEENKALVLVRDITDSKAVESALMEAKEHAEQADKMKTQFLAQMSHEIRTPINAILSLNSLIKDEVRGKIDNDVYDLYNSIESAGRRLIRTIDLLLNMSELQTGAYDAKFVKFNPAEIITSIIKEMEVIAKQKKLHLIFNIKTENAEIFGDQYSIAQIIINLLDNAIKYTKIGKIEIDLLKKENGKISIIIKDTGIGIKKEFIPKLFDPFTQEEEGYIRSFEGTGLGLALVKRYCDINNATIEIESEKGEGTKIQIGFSTKDFNSTFINN